MKKIILLIIPIIILTGCTKKAEIFEKYAKEYYENHMKMVNNIDSVTITLGDLKNAKDEDGYDLKPLEKCENSSKITFSINKTTKEIENKKIDIKS